MSISPHHHRHTRSTDCLTVANTRSLPRHYHSPPLTHNHESSFCSYPALSTKSSPIGTLQRGDYYRELLKKRGCTLFRKIPFKEGVYRTPFATPLRRRLLLLINSTPFERLFYSGLLLYYHPNLFRRDPLSSPSRRTLHQLDCLLPISDTPFEEILCQPLLNNSLPKRLPSKTACGTTTSQHASKFERNRRSTKIVSRRRLSGPQGSQGRIK